VAFRFNNWLTIKVTRKKYGAGRGELMLIHLCIECGRPSINRIAADDDSQKVFNVFVDSFRLEIPPQSRLDANGIRALQAPDSETVRTQLFGDPPDLAGMLFQSEVVESV
jgi:hypothetical protein